MDKVSWGGKCPVWQKGRLSGVGRCSGLLCAKPCVDIHGVRSLCKLLALWRTQSCHSEGIFIYTPIRALFAKQFLLNIFVFSDCLEFAGVWDWWVLYCQFECLFLVVWRLVMKLTGTQWERRKAVWHFYDLNSVYIFVCAQTWLISQYLSWSLWSQSDLASCCSVMCLCYTGHQKSWGPGRSTELLQPAGSACLLLVLWTAFSSRIINEIEIERVSWFCRCRSRSLVRSHTGSHDMTLGVMRNDWIRGTVHSVKSALKPYWALQLLWGYTGPSLKQPLSVSAAPYHIRPNHLSYYFYFFKVFHPPAGLPNPPAPSLS